MKHITLTPEQQATANTRNEALVFTNDRCYLGWRVYSTASALITVLETDGTLTTAFSIPCILQGRPFTDPYRGVYTNGVIYTSEKHPDRKAKFHEQVFDPVTCDFRKERNGSSMRRYNNGAVLTVPYVRVTGGPNACFTGVTVKAHEYNDQVVALVNKVIDQLNLQWTDL